MMKNKKIVILIMCLMAVLIIAFYLISKDKSNYEEFNKLDNTNKIEWESTGLDFDRVLNDNKELFEEYKLDMSSYSEKDFYFDGNGWDITVLSLDNVVYKIYVTASGEVSITDVMNDSIPE